MFKHFISLLTISTMMATQLAIPMSQSLSVTTGTLDAPLYANYFSSAVISDYSGSTYEQTTNAESTDTEDVILGAATDDALYIGFDNPFDAISLSVYTSGAGGSYEIQYYSSTTSDWETLVSETSNITNDENGVFQMVWEQPTDWTTTTVAIDFAEDTATATDPYYFVRLIVTNDYDTNMYLTQVGVTTFNITAFNFTDELGTAFTADLDYASFDSAGTGDDNLYYYQNDAGTHDLSVHAGDDATTTTDYTYTLGYDGYVAATDTVTTDGTGTDLDFSASTLSFAHLLIGTDSTGTEVTLDSATAGNADTACTISGNYAYCPISIDEDNDETGTIYADGYAPTDINLENREATTDAQETSTTEMNYAYILTVQDSAGDAITSATVTTGDLADIDCEYLGTGQYGCVVPITNVLGTLEVSATDYQSKSTAFDSVRTANTDAQITKTITLLSDSELPDLIVDEIYLNDTEDGYFLTVQNESDFDIDETTDLNLTVTVDETITVDIDLDENNELDFRTAGGTSTFGDYSLTEGDHTITACIDLDDTVEEADEENNCTTEILTVEKNGIDLTIYNLYLDRSNDIIFTVGNDGDEDVEDNDKIHLEVYVDSHQVWSASVTNQASNNFLNAGNKTTINTGKKLNKGVHIVEVCVDTENNLNEYEEQNNCATKRFVVGKIDPIIISSSDCDHPFTDIDNHWAEDEICYLYNENIINGDSYYTYNPNDATTRAEFLKFLLLSAGYQPYGVSNVSYNDVAANDWYYNYVTYATYLGFANGDNSGYFRPNDTITRAEAIVLTMRVYGEELWLFNQNYINFWDVDVNDWYAYAVILADQDHVMKGYDDGSFRPDNNLSRAEAAVVVVNAINAYSH